jgi:hypothetical protein
MEQDSLKLIEISNEFKMDFEFMERMALKAGEGWMIDLELDLKKLFTDLDLDADEPLIVERIMENMSGALTRE